DHGARAVVPLRDDILEIEILEWMVLRVDRQAFVARIQTRTFGDGEAAQHPAHLQAQVPVHAARGVLMHYVVTGVGPGRAEGAFRRKRLGGSGRIALASISVETFGGRSPTFR